MLEPPQHPPIPARVEAVQVSSVRAADDVRALREQLAERTRQLQASEASREESEADGRRQAELLEAASHDLRSPLSAIIGYADLMEMRVPASANGDSREYASRIKAAAVNLQVLLDQLLASAHESAA